MATTTLDANNVIKKVYDPATESLKTTATAIFPGQLEVIIDASDGDNIAISDGVNTLAINPDGSINVNLDAVSGTIINRFNEVLAVPSGLSQMILSYTAASNSSLRQIKVSGTNIAEYSVYVNNILIDKSYTYWSGGLNYTFDLGQGVSVLAGQTCEVFVLHNRPDVGNFNTRIQVVE